MTTPNAQQPVGWSPATAARTLMRTAGQHAAFLLPYLEPGMRLLDCGCGPGTITLGLAEAVAPGEVIGIDVGGAQIELAKANAAQKGTQNVRFQVADVTKLPFEDDSFDAVYANALLMWVNEPLGALWEIRRVLRPGGLIGVRDPDGGSAVFDPGGAGLYQLWEEGKHLVWGGRDPRTGRRNRGLLRRAGFVHSEGFADCEYVGAPEAVRAFAETQSKWPNDWAKARAQA
ncbi:MAG: class I SAM-dependent methyltransferase [Chloroflexi bacterium]|nr:class I SAM-dependent methyltransferase [Chloroflexota bacterium]